MTELEEKCRRWAKPPGADEARRCENAASAIKNAVEASDELDGRSVRVFLQGSYANNTNVRGDSDVDVGIICSNTFYYQLPEGMTPEDFSISPAKYHYDQFKSDLEASLRSYFRSGSLSRGNKAFDLHETTYHVEADIAPFFEHRRYSPDRTYISGMELIADNGGKAINWPEQHLKNCREKNKTSGGRYKSLVRVLKGLNVELGDPVPGFLVECLVWNVPNDCFGASALTADLRDVLSWLHEKISSAESDEWGEVSELKYLFRPAQKWSKQQALDFVTAVRRHADL